MFVIHANTISDAWYKAIDVIWKSGDIVDTEYGIKAKQVLNLIVEIKQPLEEPMVPIPDNPHKILPFDRNYCDKYFSEYIFYPGKKEKEDYTYAERIKWQIDLAISRLMESKRKGIQTRRCSLEVGRPEDIILENPACLRIISLQPDEGFLHGTVFFRSHDIGVAYVPNLYGLTRLVEFIASKSGYQMGTMTSISNNAHLYESFWNFMEKKSKSNSNK